MPFYVNEERTFIGPEVDGAEHPIVSWEWDFGDGAVVSGQLQIVTHIYNIAGTYNVSLTTTNDCDAKCTETQTIPIEQIPGCNQEFRVYNKQGLPIEAGWTVVVEITEDVITAPVVNGMCTILLPEGEYFIAHAEKGAEQTEKVGATSCSAGISLYQMVTCYEPTEHFASGRDLLLYYDTDGNGVLSQQEAAQAIMNGNVGAINTAEAIFVVKCWETYAGVINDMCPSLCPTPSCGFVVT